MSVAFGGNASDSSQAKIGNFELLLIWNEEILGFEIAMKNFFFMAMLNAVKKLIAKTLDK